MSHVSPNPDTIFAEAIEIESPDDRTAFLKQACKGDAQLLDEVKKLVQDHFRAGNFLERQAIDRQQTSAYSPVSETAGTQIGPYKLLQQIGEGGMGVVYMAEQQKPVQRRVALKIIKPGMDSRAVIARFEAERQALAMMDHPNIARVLDAGCTESGRPYFVMELIQGIPITQYCDDKQLDTHQRLELFTQVCHAVQHAHQKGIIHRDLKPSNVLIAIYDAKPVPKIIDFGVAKALHQRLTEKTMFTQFGAVVGTLEYMSPEQADMDLMGTDTRSDIYSLGVLLYELLTGSTPLDGKKLRSLGYAEMLKTIREVDPPKPSTRLSQSSNEVASISAKRQTEPRRLQKMVAGDLDWIVMKCLEKDRTRRYETATGLALDIQRHLQDETVSASPPGQFYKLQKMVRRNKLACTAAASVMLALLLGMAASLWQAERAQHEADRASQALNDLQAAAPSIAAEARALAAQEKFDEAIGKLEYAAKLRPDVPDYLMAQADLLETQLRLSDAAAVYRAVLQLNSEDARAKENAELCEQLAVAPRGTDGKVSPESLSRLGAQMNKDQRRAAEIIPIARLLGDEKKYIVDYWLDRLKDLPVGTEKPLKERLSVTAEGLLNLDLSDTQVADLSPLAGMPLGTLSLANCNEVIDLSPLHELRLTELTLDNTSVASLRPLRGMSSLQKLIIDGTKVSDLSPLAGLPLKELSISRCPVTSLESLRGMPLEKLGIRSTGVSNLSPLTGMPLKKLDATAVPVTDFSPLAGLPLESCLLQAVRVGDLAFLKGAPLKQLSLVGSVMRNLAILSEIRTLEVLALPNMYDLSDEDFSAVEALRNHPSIKQLAAEVPISMKQAPSKDEFWKNWDRDYAWALRLRKAKFSFTSGRKGGGTWSLSCHDQPLGDLSILKGAAISELIIYNDNNVTDLTPLKGLPLTKLDLGNDHPSVDPIRDVSALRGLKLEWLSLHGTHVSDLSPLRDMPLNYIDLQKCDELKDLTPLASIPTLECVLLPIHAVDLEPLRKLPNLRVISFRYEQCAAETFWKTWDGLPWARKLEAAGIDFSIEQSEDGYYGVTVNDPKFTDCSIFSGSKNIRRLNLDHTRVTDLNPLADLLLIALSLRDTPIKDLSPLRSAALRDAIHEVFLGKTSIVDFSPIADCRKLEQFDASDTVLSDLSIVKDMKLRVLNVARTNVTAIAPIAEMPLEDVYLSGTKVADISPLLKCPTVKSITLPDNSLDIESLHALPNLARVSFDAANEGGPDKTVDQFWASLADRAKMPLAALDKAKLTYTTRRLKDGSWELILDHQPITDLTILKGAPITRLSIADAPVTDLSPLRGMKLTYLRISSTMVSDLSPIQGMPITNLTMTGTAVHDLTPLVGMPLRNLSMGDCKQITDLSPLADMKSLDSITLPPGAKNIDFLREFPKLTKIGYKSDKNIPQAAADFWAEYDRAKGAAVQ
jgi:eukaryotic-like serine/threonine-protein kinase